MIKKIKQPPSAPEILVNKLLLQNLDNNPIKITLPQVKNVTEWKPINISVATKLRTTNGIYLIPKKAGT